MSDEYKALIKKAYSSSKIQFTKDTGGIFEQKHWKREGRPWTENDRKRKHRQKVSERQTKPRVYEEKALYISQGSVATQLKCGGIIHNLVIANYIQSLPVEELFKSVNIWRKCGQQFCGTF